MVNVKPFDMKLPLLDMGNRQHGYHQTLTLINLKMSLYVVFRGSINMLLFATTCP